MFGRYRRLVPKEHRDLIRRHRLGKPNWFIGSAERPFYANDPTLRAEIEELKAEIDRHARRLAFDDMPNMREDAPARNIGKPASDEERP